MIVKYFQGHKRLLFLMVLLGEIFASCKKYVDVPGPIDQLDKILVFNNDSTAVQSLYGIYSDMMNSTSRFSTGSTTFYAGLCSDELYYYTTSSRDEFANNQITIANHSTVESNFWSPLYKYIYAANACIEGVTASGTLSPAVKKMVEGEAKFIRAFCYFHLVNLFGEVPLILSTDYRENMSVAKTPKTDVYTQIVNDCLDAQNLLLNNYPSTGKARPNKWTVTALLSRVYLYLGDWANAERQASDIIGSGTYTIETNLDNVFLVNNSEAIWQLMPVLTNSNTVEGNQIIPTSNSTTPTYLIRASLVNSFELNDQRKNKWMKSRSFASQTLYYPFKYKVRTNANVTEAYVVFRLAEIYLIRAEARAQQERILEAQADLNIIRKRAGLSNTAANDKPSLVSALERERQVELFAEWGHRWFDLKRTDRADVVLGSLKPTTWKSTDVFWPIPQNQINLNKALIQNLGYEQP